MSNPKSHTITSLAAAFILGALGYYGLVVSPVFESPSTQAQPLTNVITSAATPTPVRQRSADTLRLLGNQRTLLDFEIALLRSLMHYSAEDVQQLFNPIVTQLTGSRLRIASNAIVRHWAQQAPHQALARLLKSNHPLQAEWIVTLFGHWPVEQFETAQQAIENLPLWLRYEALSALLAASSSTAVVQRLELAEQLGVYSSPFNSNEEFVAAWEQISNLPASKQKDKRLHQIASSWVQSNPQHALDAIQQLPAGDARTGLVDRALSSWAFFDGPAAIDWLLLQPHSPETTARILANTVYFFDPSTNQFDALLTAVGETNQPILRQRLIPALATSDTEAAIELFAQLGNLAEDQRSINSIGYQLATRFPSRYLDWLSTLPEDTKNAAVTIGLYSLSAEDFDIALTAIDKLEDPTSSLHNRAFLVSQMTAKQPQQIRQWIAEQPDVQRPPLYKAFTQSLASTNLDAALSIANSLSDPGERSQAMLGALPLLDDPAVIAELFQEAQDRDVRTAIAHRAIDLLEYTDPLVAAQYREYLQQ